MADLFLSYARENKRFVRKLYDALSDADYQIWVDWEGIPPSAEWFQEITSAIEAAQAFVFVISPDSVGSEVCLRELAHAVDLNKRLIPILHQEVEDARVPEAVRKLNWVFARERDDFDLAFQSLRTAIDTDLEWVHSHTRLLVRASEWDQARRDKSFTLRGRDLREAEAWLSAANAKEPEPTGLHTQYIIASRRAANRRQTVILSAVTTGLVVAVVLAAVAYYQYTVSEQRRKIATSRQLAAQANNRLDGRLDLALLLSVEAYRTYPTVEARRTLFNAVQHNPRLTTFLHGHTAGVLSLSFSPDASRLVSGGWDHTVRFWDVASGQPIGAAYTGHSNPIRSVAFSPDGGLVATGSCAQFRKGLCQQGEIRLIDSHTRRLVGSPLRGHTDWVYSVAFSPDGRMLASGSADNTVRLWEVATGRPVGLPFTGHASWVVCVAFSPRGDRLASASWDETIRLWDVASGEPIGSPMRGYKGWPGRNLAFHPRGDIIVASGSDATIQLWNVANGGPIGTPLKGHRHQVSGLAFGPDGNLFLSASRDGTVNLWETATRRQLDTALTGHANEVLSLAWSPDGGTVASGDRDGGIILWHLTKRTPLATILAANLAPVARLALMPGGAMVSLEGRPMDGVKERLTTWDLSKGEPIIQSDIQASILSEALSTDGRILATSTRSKKNNLAPIMLWDVATGRRLGNPIKSRHGYVTCLAFDREDRQLAAGHEDGSIALWDLGTREPIASPLKAHTGRVEQVVFSADAKILASSGSDQTVQLWDLKRHRRIGEPLKGHRGRVMQMAFSPDDRVLASSSAGKTSDENAIIFWDLAARQRMGTPLAGQRAVGALAFDADGQVLAAAHDDGTIALIDVATRQPIGRLSAGQTSRVNALAFGSSPRQLASASGDLSPGRHPDGTRPRPDGTIVLWDLSIESWVQQACRRANRDLSPEMEWDRYIAYESYRQTCP